MRSRIAGGRDGGRDPLGVGTTRSASSGRAGPEWARSLRTVGVSRAARIEIGWDCDGERGVERKEGGNRARATTVVATRARSSHGSSRDQLVQRIVPALTRVLTFMTFLLFWPAWPPCSGTRHLKPPRAGARPRLAGLTQSRCCTPSASMEAEPETDVKNADEVPVDRSRPPGIVRSPSRKRRKAVPVSSESWLSRGFFFDFALRPRRRDPGSRMRRKVPGVADRVGGRERRGEERAPRRHPWNDRRLRRAPPRRACSRWPAIV